MAQAATTISPPEPTEQAPAAARPGTAPGTAPAPGAAAPKRRRGTFYEWLEGSLSRLSTRNNFWHRICSMIWLPFAFRSGIQMKRVDENTFTAVLPFNRFNKNWYNAMAGAALLGNSEIAGGMYVFAAVGRDYTVVCKELTYRFLRPCLGPAIYRVRPMQDVHELVARGDEFNIEIEKDIVQQTHIAGVRLPGKPGKYKGRPAPARSAATGAADDQGTEHALAAREKRVGRCKATFHVTPKAHHRAKLTHAAQDGAGQQAESTGAAGITSANT